MDKDFEKMYNTLAKYENQLHEKNQKRIKIGIRCIIIIPLIFLTLMFLTDSSKEIFLILWILSLFILSIYLILVEYADYKLQERLSEICGDTDREIQPLIPEKITDVEAKLVQTIMKIDDSIGAEEELKSHNEEHNSAETSSKDLLEEKSSEKHI